LDYYIPKKEDILGVTSGIRPYRSEGIRMEKELLQGKTVYHHYGHGGAGLSVAYGCCKQVMETLFENPPIN
jgi:hypothetical protein